MVDYSNSIEKALESDDKRKKKRSKFNYEKKEIYGKVEVSKHWNIEVNQTSWNNRKAKYEIRKWKNDGKPGKGITCNKEQFQKLIDLMKNIELKNVENENTNDLDKEIAINDIVENYNGERGKVKQIEDHHLLVKATKDNERWNIKKCKFIRKGKKTY